MWGPTAYKPHTAVAHFTTDCDFLSIVLRRQAETSWLWALSSQLLAEIGQGIHKV